MVVAVPEGLLGGRLRVGRFLRTGHRGARALAPENTLAGFERAAREGVDVLELDVQCSADGEVVVFHDPTLERTTDGEGPLHARRWASLAALDAGYRFTPDGGETFPFRGQEVRIPRLSDVLGAFPELAFTIELKPSPDPRLIPSVAAIVREHAPDRVVVGSFEHSLLEAFRAAAPEIPTSCSAREITRLFLLGRLPLLGRVARTPARVIQMPRFSDHDHDRGLRLATRGFFRHLHELGLPVNVWTINDAPVMHELLDLGVDGITTDRPDVLNAVLRERPGER